MSSESIAATRADESAILAPSSPARTGTGKPKRRYIDCLRGYAVFMVMVSHTAYAFVELPYPVHRIATFGWFGVQLFFLASCLTLMGSSTYERDHVGKMQVGHFFIRRFLRIAPVYYAAGLFYLFAKSTEGASLAQALVDPVVRQCLASHPDGAGRLAVGGRWLEHRGGVHLLLPVSAVLCRHHQYAPGAGALCGDAGGRRFAQLAAFWGR